MSMTFEIFLTLPLETVFLLFIDIIEEGPAGGYSCRYSKPVQGRSFHSSASPLTLNMTSLDILYLEDVHNTGSLRG